MSQYLDFAELQTIEKATREFEEYRRKEMLQYESDDEKLISSGLVDFLSFLPYYLVYTKTTRFPNSELVIVFL